MTYDSKGLLTITLCSDLCAGSGYAYAGVIDSDICYDDFGLPYIPAKRLKGCMRESAQSILYDFISQEDVEKLFGAAGKNHVDFWLLIMQELQTMIK